MTDSSVRPQFGLFVPNELCDLSAGRLSAETLEEIRELLLSARLHRLRLVRTTGNETEAVSFIQEEQ